MRSAQSARTPNRGVVDRRSQIEYIMRGRRALITDVVMTLLPLDEVTATRAVFVIVSGRTDGRAETPLEPAK